MRSDILVENAVIGAIHAPPIPAALSCVPEKRTLFGVDSYFRDSWEDACASLGQRVDDFLQTHSLLLIKPDAVAAHRVGEAITWLVDYGATIVAAERCGLTPHVIRALWHYQWNLATRDRRDLADLLMPACDSLVLLVRHDRADVPLTLVLSRAKGPADPAERRPGQLRYVLGRENYLLNFVHTTDEPADLVREIGVLVETARRPARYRAALESSDALAEARRHADELQAQIPLQDLSLHGALSRLDVAWSDAPAERDELKGALESVRTGESRDWRGLLERAAAAGVHVGRWDKIVIGTHLMIPTEPGRQPLLASVTPAQWKDARMGGDGTAAAIGVPAEPAGTPHRALTWDQPIPRDVVHKSAVAEVLVTDSASLSDDSMLLAAELPRTHSYYSDLGGYPVRFEAIPILELCRQACFVMAHRHYGVPPGLQFILRAFGVRQRRSTLFDRVEEPLRVLVECDVSRKWFSDDLDGLQWSFDLRAPDGSEVATATMSMSWMSRERWAGIRAKDRRRLDLPPAVGYVRPEPSDLPAATVGREATANVVLRNLRARGDTVWGQLVVDLLHPGLFDHYVDHISGMLEAEACRQMALWVTSEAGATDGRTAIQALDLTFTAVGEVDLPIQCEGKLLASQPHDDSRRVAVELMQRGKRLCAGTVEVTWEPGGAGPADVHDDSKLSSG